MQNNIVLQVDCHGGFKELRYRAIVYICLSHCANITCFCQKKHTHTHKGVRENQVLHMWFLLLKKKEKKSSGTIFGLWIFIFAGTVIRFPNLETLGNGKGTKLSLSIFSSFVLTRGTVPELSG